LSVVSTHFFFNLYNHNHDRRKHLDGGGHGIARPGGADPGE